MNRIAAHALPKSGTRRPWKIRHSYVYVLDTIDHRLDRIEGVDGVFGRAATAPAATIPSQAAATQT